MKYEQQLKLQAFLDGELEESESREVANWLARDQEAASLLAELRHTRQALVGFETGVQLPETREFFWSKIEREIGRSEQPEPVREKPSLLALWRRLLVPAGALAVLAIAAMLAMPQLGGFGSAPGAEAASEYNGGFTYRDDSAQPTLVWLAYPAENEIAQSDQADTVP